MRSIQRRLIFGLLGVLLPLVVAGAAALYVVLRATLLTQFDAGLRVKALVVITATRQKGQKLDVRFSDRFLREFDDDVASDYFQVWVEGGKSVERSDSLGNRNLPLHFGSLESPEFWNMELPRVGGPGRAIGIRFQPRIDGSNRNRSIEPIDAVVVVAAQRGDLDAMLRQAGWTLALGGLGLLLITTMAVSLVVRPNLRPIRDMADRAQAIDASSLGKRFSLDEVPVELRPICERLNDLLARLDESFQRERRFSADLAHELLTPLAELRAIAESALKWPETADPGDHRKSLDIMLRMEQLVTRVLELARAEHGSRQTEMARIDLARLLRELAAAHASAANARQVEIVCDGTETSSVHTDPGVLHVILGNLLSNSVAYAPTGTAVMISWAVREYAFEISVANRAPDIQPEDLPHLFERFWRKDSSRTGTRHSGLGLSVSAGLASMLGGSLTATKSGGDVLILTLTMPNVAAMPREEGATDMTANG